MANFWAPFQWPWLILLFCPAVVASTYLPVFYPVLKHPGMIGLRVTLYLIGAGLSMKTLREVGARPLFQGIIVAVGSLTLIRGGWIHL